MDEEYMRILRCEAEDLAIMAFDDPSEEHIQVVFCRLLMNREWGLGNEGVVTVH